ncbi:MAG: diguanylate cyclase, partial [Gammaproteobacteria bacterium]|nr:diguanylate cyclase [Gammaproteobacteria bacterium]
MKFKSLYFFIPCIGLGSLAFIGLIAYQSIDSFTASKQQELLKDIALQITANTPNKNAREADWISWVNKDRLIITSRLSIILQHTDGEIIALHGGHEPQLDTSQAKALISALTKKDPQDKYVIDNNLKHISHTSKIADTPYSLLLTHTSAKEDNSFYFKRLGMPVLIASVIVLWVSIWLAIILTNLYRRLDNQKQLIEHDSLHDPLTGLANRVLLTNRINQAINEAKHDNNQLAICMLDLDRFKEINDALGHEYGDKLLIEVATRIKSIVRDIDTVARIGGDEFAILLRHTDTETTRNIAERISTSLKSEFIIDDERFHISGSLGISFYPEHGTQPEILMKHADLTMYHVKNNNYEYAIYSPEQENTRKNTLFLYSDLVEAINNNQFEIHYQPKLNIKQNSIEGIEALLRWNHPKRGIIPPDDFIPLAEQTGLVRKISRWVLKRAIKDQLILKNYDI